MTAEVLLVILLAAAFVVGAGITALLVSAFGVGAWLGVLALGVAAILLLRFAVSRAEWSSDELGDDPRAG